MLLTATMPPLRETLHQWQARALEKGTKQASMFAVGIPFIVITSIVVILRVHVRLSLLRSQLALDDCEPPFCRMPIGVILIVVPPDLMLAGTFFTISLSVANMICKLL